MNTENKPNKCLSREELEDLAIRFTTEGEALNTPGEGSSAVLPADLFTPEETGIRDHLENCRFCSLRLLAEIHQRGEYLKAVGDSLSETVLEDKFNKVKATIIRFRYAPYRNDLELMPLAASSADASKKPIRFESEGGKLICKTESGSGDQAQTCRIYGQLPQLETGLYLFVDGIKYSVLCNGEILLEDQSIQINPESEVYLEIRQ